MKTIKLKLEIDDAVYDLLANSLSQNPQNPDVTGMCLSFVKQGIATVMGQIANSKIAIVPSDTKPSDHPASRPMEVVEAPHGKYRRKGRKSST